MRELNIEKRLTKIEDNILAIRQMLEELLKKPMDNRPIGNNEEIMNVKQVAQFLNLDPNVVYAKCSKGDIPYFKIGKGYRFNKTDILKWVEKQKIETPEICVDDYVNEYLQKNVLKA